MTVIKKVYEKTASQSMPMTECAITSAQQKLWDQTRTATMWHCPAFTHILYTMMNPKGRESIAYFTKDVPIAATDGVNLILNPDTFFGFTLAERVFIVAHEIMHCIWDHCGMMHVFRRRGEIKYPDGTKLPYDPTMMNVATDLVINDLLVQSKVGTFNKGWLHDPSKVTQNDSAIDAYRKVYKMAKGKGGGGGAGQGFDEHLQPGTGDKQDPSQAQQGRSEMEWKTAVAAAAASAKAQGKLPAGLERFFSEVLEPQVDWTEHIRTLITRKVGNDSYDWRKLDRRLIVRGIGSPGRTGFGAGTIVVVADTSGSINGPTLNAFLAEMSGILQDVRPERLVVLWADATVAGVDEVEEAAQLTELKPKGGGGTDFRPAFDWVRDNADDVECLVYLTDGYGSFPGSAPNYPVIWGSITPNYVYPFGEVVDIPVQHA